MLKNNCWKLSTFILGGILVLVLSFISLSAKEDLIAKDFGKLRTALNHLKTAKNSMAGITVLPSDKNELVKSAMEYTDKAIENVDKAVTIVKKMQQTRKR